MKVILVFTWQRKKIAVPWQTYLLFSVCRSVLCAPKSWWGCQKQRSTLAEPTVAPCVPSASVTGNSHKASFIPQVASYRIFTSFPNFEGSCLTLVMEDGGRECGACQAVMCVIFVPWIWGSSCVCGAPLWRLLCSSGFLSALLHW